MSNSSNLCTSFYVGNVCILLPKFASSTKEPSSHINVPLCRFSQIRNWRIILWGEPQLGVLENRMTYPLWLLFFVCLVRLTLLAKRSLLNKFTRSSYVPCCHRNSNNRWCCSWMLEKKSSLYPIVREPEFVFHMIYFSILKLNKRLLK